MCKGNKNEPSGYKSNDYEAYQANDKYSNIDVVDDYEDQHSKKRKYNEISRNNDESNIVVSD